MKIAQFQYLGIANPTIAMTCAALKGGPRGASIISKLRPLTYQESVTDDQSYLHDFSWSG